MAHRLHFKFRNMAAEDQPLSHYREQPTDMTFQGRTALVTGGGTGIGLHLASQLHRDGASVVICGRRGAAIEDVCARHPGMRGLPCDLTRDEDILRLENFVRSTLGGLDLLFNNAAVQTQDDLTDPDSDFLAIETEIRTNLIAPIRITQRLLPLMSGRPGATIVNLVSLLAVMAKPSAPIYCASKAGLMQFTRAMELVLSSSGIRMVTAMPPLVETAMTHGRGANKMSAEDCASELLRQLEAGKRDIRIGQARGQMALHRLLPGLAAAVTRRRSAGRTLPETTSEPVAAGKAGL